MTDKDLEIQGLRKRLEDQKRLTLEAAYECCDCCLRIHRALGSGEADCEECRIMEIKEDAGK